MITCELLNSLFDYKEGELYWKVRPSQGVLAGTRAGSFNGRYRQIKINGKFYLEHRVIYMMFNGVLPEMLDHIDGDKINNKIENLRPCTDSENKRNTTIRKNNTSGIKGVTWHIDKQKWLAQLSIDGKQTHLGYYNNLAEAATVVKIARERHHGEFAKHS